MNIKDKIILKIIKFKIKLNDLNKKIAEEDKKSKEFNKALWVNLKERICSNVK